MCNNSSAKCQKDIEFGLGTPLNNKIIKSQKEKNR